ncbi:MAG: ABC transporter permease [Arenicellales bacterium]|nr:ABC transporter permease [Arenicellales bacterium]
MNRSSSKLTRNLIALWAACILVFMYLPLACVALASFSKNRYFRFPIPKYDTVWYSKAFDSLTVQGLFETSLSIALLVTAISVVLAFFGSLAFARFDWRGRKVFQKIILLPIFFPQAVLGLALLLWLSSIGIIPDWRTAVFAHLIWIVPIATLVMSIQAYSFDPALEEAAFDLGATRWQTFREVTIPILWPGIFSGALFSFLLSWGNFPLSLFTTGADQTIPEWLYAKMVSGYTPLVPTLGALTTLGAALVLLGGYAIIVFSRGKGAK